MRKFSQILALLILASCYDGSGVSNCFSWASDYDKATAQSYYETIGTSLVSDKTFNRIKPKFKCEYRTGDKIYSYSTFWDTKYILVRHGQAVTYVEGK
jgi:hypothetical protein